MNVIIFSKDRPLQLDALLRSFRANAPYEQCMVQVLWTCSSPNFEPAYKQLIKEHEGRGVSFVRENPERFTFKQQVLGLVDEERPLTMFLVDDILFKAPFTLEDDAINSVVDLDVFCCSLRLNERVNYCYPTKAKVKPPSFVRFGEHTEAMSFCWIGAEGDWGYPLSVDGHIFKTDIIRGFVKMLDYHNPNSFESAMAHVVNMGFCNHMPNMSCYQEGKLFNIPTNRVQDTALNRHAGTTTPEDLLMVYLSGKRIKIDVYQNYPNNAPHVDIALRWD